MAERRVVVRFRGHAADGPGGFVRVASAGSVAEAADELSSWQGPPLSHGDLAVIDELVGGTSRAPSAGYVFDADSSSFVAWPAVPLSTGASSWLDAWEGGKVSPDMMVFFAAGVAPQNVAAAVVECARLLEPLVEGDSALVFKMTVAGADKVLRGGLSKESIDGLVREAGRWAQGQTRRSAEEALRAASGALQCSVAAPGAGKNFRSYASAHALSCSRAAQSGRRSRGRAAPTEAEMCVAVRWHLPLSAVMCGRLGLRSPFAPGWIRRAMVVSDG